ncbi:unnamed protein product [Lymnaea stagnalis]|uniref:Peptidase M14 domain-containing protein n=1 Tax=Lymnaea stagnalis TaxID=6523 RepID=A0AAV2HIZ0_LYMST
MIPEEDLCDDDYYGINPYESFMKKHLQHYGYYTGRNQNYKNQFQHYAEWEKNYGYNLSSDSSEDSELDSDDDKIADSKLQEDLLRTTQLIYSCGESGKMVPRLREPRSLYALTKELGPQQAARWPSDLQVINERVRHIQTITSEPEPFYRQTGFEKCPMVRGEASGGRVVFSYETNTNFYMKSHAGGSRNGCEPCAVSLDSENDKTLIFESRFESGNLGKVVQVGEREYELSLRYDLYTNKHTQWFYFRVSNTRADMEYRFTICNFIKSDSLYNDGMKPVMYSEKEAELHKIGWVRAGSDIKYYKNNLRYETVKGERSYYSMTWTIKFKHDHDTVYFSHCYPYTYTDLQNYLLELTNDPIKSRICKQRVLCRTLAGNLVYVLTITSASQNPEDMKHKKAVVVTSRAHPGESNSSWMMKGLLDFVTSNSPDAKLLRDTFIFKIVPMLNPDGVIVGNYRCSLTGRDLNRNYKTALKDAYPSVWHTKSMIRKLLIERDIIVYCDLHGHSRRQNVFIYGCEQKSNSNKRFHERIFPSMMSRNTPDKFCFKSCKFKVQKSKEGTGRVVMWNMGIMNSYTMEATFCGSSLGRKKGFHFNQRDFEMMGYHFCDTLLDYCDPDNTKYNKILDDLKEKHQMMVLAKLAEKGLNPEDADEFSDFSTDTESSDGGSDSSISDGPPVHLQFATPRPKKKKLKSKKDRDKASKEDQRKTTPVEDKRMRNNQVKPLKQEASKPMKYTSNGTKRTRAIDERTNSGIPVFVQERFEEKQQKRHDYLEALTAAYISNNVPIVTDPAFVKLDCNQNKANTDADRFQSVYHELELRKLTPKWLQEEAARQIKTAKRAEASNMEDLLKAHLAHNATTNPMNRRYHPHILEVSAAQQRQTEALSRDKNSPIKKHPNPFDETLEPSKNATTDVPVVPPAASSAPNKVKLTLVQGPPASQDSHPPTPEEPASRKSGQRSGDKSGRKSRKAMRGEDEGEEHKQSTSTQSASEVSDIKVPQKQLQRVKSARSGHVRTTPLTNAPEVQISLQSPRSEGASNAVNTAGEFIQKLIQETSEEIKDLTNEIQEDIEKKNLQKSRGVNTKTPTLPSTEHTQDDVRSFTSHSSVTQKMEYQSLNNHQPMYCSIEPEVENSKSTAAGKTVLPSVIFPISMVNDTTSHLKKTADPNWNVGQSPTNSLKLTTETELNIKNKEMQDEKMRSRSLKRQASFNAAPPMAARTAQGRSIIGNSSGNLTRRAGQTGITQQKSATPGPEDVESNPSSSLYRQLSSVNSNQFASYSQIGKGVRLNRHNLVFKTEGHSEFPSSASLRSPSQQLIVKDTRGLELGENGEPTRSRSARSNTRQVVETVPAKISLMICQDHQDNPSPSGHFVPPSHQGHRSLFSRQQVRKK